MRHVCENILQLPIYMWPSNGLEMAYRYLPTLKVKFKNILASSSPNNRSSTTASGGGGGVELPLQTTNLTYTNKLNYVGRNYNV